ncbi:MAG: Flp pilus assembly complex ATPase component TadA [Planctomycetaceae bacterium]|nr:Flp pilus assembly complex ATPase component TadA [Planctomycetaceae bacterium]
MRWRIDGVLQTVAAFEGDLKQRIIARLKVISGLLTYRTDVPQEGRVSVTGTSIGHASAGVDSNAQSSGKTSLSLAALRRLRAPRGEPSTASSQMTSTTVPGTTVSGTTADEVTSPEVVAGEVRVTTFPTLFGEKAAIRLFADHSRFLQVDDLGLPDDIRERLQELLQQTSGVILLTGPSGSGKTTTVYACLREIVRTFGDQRGVMTLEDPIEVVVPGVTQSQVRHSVGFDLASGLKSMMRQDPDVIAVGEIRDAATAESVLQAALTGHLVLTTFHAGSSVEAITRLMEMGMEPYLIRSTIQAVLCQRLVRRRCPECHSEKEANSDESVPAAATSESDSVRSAHCAPIVAERSTGVLSSSRSNGLRGVPASEEKFSGTHCLDKSDATVGLSGQCPVCQGLGYVGRFVIAELLETGHPDFVQGLMERADARHLHTIARQCGMESLQQRAEAAVQNGLTTEEEVFRVLGRHRRVSADSIESTASGQ